MFLKNKVYPLRIIETKAQTIKIVVFFAVIDLDRQNQRPQKMFYYVNGYEYQHTNKATQENKYKKIRSARY
jgi:hypothetical protein